MPALQVTVFGLTGTPLLLACLAAVVVAALCAALVKRRRAGSAGSPAAPETPVPPAPAETPPAAETADGFTEPYTPGLVTLDGVDEEDAAVLMAITADRLGVPPEKLCFRSVRRLGPEISGATEQEAAVLMAVTAYKTGKAPETLNFKSIKLVEE